MAWTLLVETVVGLPRSSLVKSKTPNAMPLRPVVIAAPIATPPPAVSVAPDPFTDPFAAPITEREPFQTKADDVDVTIDTARTAEQPKPEPPRRPYESAPSANTLLERAAALGPARMTWESIVLTSDPVLDEKRQPHVAERRERLTRIVKVTLGGCLAVCVVALGVSALSQDSSTSASAASGDVARTVAAKGIVPVEPLDTASKHGKAAHRPTPTVVTAIARVKHR